jgi:hypothetical protein
MKRVALPLAVLLLPIILWVGIWHWNSRYTFVVSDPDGTAKSAELRLCGSQVALRPSDRQFSASKFIHCEGAGEILVRLSDGRETSCPIGYVTSGLGGTFEHVIDNAQCRLVRFIG